MHDTVHLLPVYVVFHVACLIERTGENCQSIVYTDKGQGKDREESEMIGFEFCYQSSVINCLLN